MPADKRRIETENAPASTGFRSQGLVAGGIFFGAGQIGAAMPQPGVLREPSTDMAEAVQLTLGHLDQVTLAAGLDRSRVFEVSGFPKVTGKKDLIQREVVNFLGFSPVIFTYLEVHDVAAHALIEMDWMATADASISAAQAAEWMRPLGHGIEGQTIRSGPFLIWNRLAGYGADLGEASHALLNDLRTKLESAGGGLEHLVKMTVYLYAFDPYPQFNEASKQHFAGLVPPTRSVLVFPQVTGQARIVVDAVALAPV